METLNTYLVEDSAVIRQSLITTLEELTSAKVVGTAADEESALQWLRLPANKVDLVIIDIFLKAGSGMGVLKFASTMNLGAKLVVLTNYATADMRRKCLAMGADRVFDKSNDIDALISYCNQT